MRSGGNGGAPEELPDAHEADAETAFDTMQIPMVNDSFKKKNLPRQLQVTLLRELVGRRMKVIVAGIEITKLIEVKIGGSPRRDSDAA